jgi:hypothetical protein
LLVSGIWHLSSGLRHHCDLSFRLADGHATFPRTIAALKYAETGATHDEVVASFDRDLDGVARLTATRRRVTPKDEQHTFEGRFFTMQPTLDESSYRMWGQVPGIMGRTLEKALDQRGDELPHLPDQPCPRSQRNADALVAIAQDSLDGTETGTDAPAPHVTVFVDATNPDTSPGHTAQIAFGPVSDRRRSKDSSTRAASRLSASMTEVPLSHHAQQVQFPERSAKP